MRNNPYIRLLILLACLAGVALPFIPAYGAEPVRIGVLAFRPKAQAQAQWQPLAVALKKAVPKHDFVVEALTYPEMNMAVAARQLDFVLTNSGHYIVLMQRSGLSSPLATLAVHESGQRATVFGGVIIARAEQDGISTLGDIKGKTVAIADPESLGGYQMQALELKHAGVDLPGDAKLVTTGMPHDLVIAAVLDGSADVGFVRTGVLEGLVREGRLDMARLKIINQQNLSDFPVAVSTDLYPEWPFAAMPHLDENLTRHVAAALFNIEEDTAATRAMGIHGFTVPADYTPVVDLLRELRLPPFEAMPTFTLRDVWKRYYWQINVALLAGGLILLLGFGLLIAIRKLNTEKRMVLLHQQRLQENELRYRTVADFTFDWEFWIMPDGTFSYMSPSCEQISGYTPEEFHADPALITRIIHPDDLSLYTGHVHQLSAQGVPTPIDFRIFTKDGRTRWISHVCRSVHDAAGQALGYRASNRDVTERKQAEADSVKAEEKFRMLFNSISDAIFIASMDAGFIQVNHSACERLGYSQEELLRMGPVDIDTPESAAKLQERVDALSKQGRLVFESGHVRKDGTVVPVELNTRIINYDGTPAILAVARDITERKRVEMELRRSNTELEQFSYSISHDMRQPLRMISSYLELLVKTLADKLDDEKREYFNFAIDGAKRMDAMMVGLLEYSRVGRKGEPPEWVESRALLDEALLFVQPAIAGARAEIRIEGEWPRIFVSPDEMLRLVQNLIGNAIKFRVAERTPEVTVTSEIVGTEWRICVADNGAGIVPGQIGRLFQVFQRLQSRAAYEGTGIGLALCRKIAEHHHGRIWAESAGEGQGSRFCVALPKESTEI
ncbi:MAG: PhnD/SsuA/transferrin family substrate-binding protein [Betaproteobacteria bacterium]|nr:PhnD/SsuA/transferrin family substrate-binding protein [Betaproteobacteria bacterium]